MPTYTVHEPPHSSADRIDRADELRFVKDGFSWMTFLLPPLGLATKKLWLPLIVYLAAIATLTAALNWIGADSGWLALVVFASSLYLGYEVSSIERVSLQQAGWSEIATVNGRNIAESERRFFETWLPAQPIIKPGWDRRAEAAGKPFGSKA